MASALVEVQRVSGGVSKYLNPFEVVIDDEVVGRLGPGESGAFEIAPGSHRVFAKCYWCRSEQIDVDLGKDQKLTLCCDTRATNFLTEGYWASFGYRRALRLTQVGSTKMHASDYVHRARESTLSQRPTRVARGGTATRASGRLARLAAITNALRTEQPTVAALLLLAVGISLFVLTWGLEFLSGISIIYLGVQAVRAINFHFLAPRYTWGAGIKSHEPFRFRIVEEVAVSAILALAGIASLTGFIHASSLGGWLAIGAAAAGAMSVIVTRRKNSATSGRTSDSDP